MRSFAPLTYPGGYLPTENYGLIGDLSTAALVGRDGSVPWLCLPHFDAPPVFCGIPDKEKGGASSVAPEGLESVRQFYLKNSGVLVTEMRDAGGMVRDAAFSVYTLRQVGIDREAQEFLGWVLDAREKHHGPNILYTIHGDPPPTEAEDSELSGYRGSAPVRWSNGAAEQTQHDVYGEIVDCAYLWALGGGTIDAPLWEKLCALTERAREVWREPVQGRIDEAEALFHSLCDQVNHLGLFAEEIDPDSGRFVGNFPQAFSHIGVTTSATNLLKRKREQHA